MGRAVLVTGAAAGTAAHLFEPGLRLHIGLLLQRGATFGRVVEAMELRAVQGLEGTQRGVCILAQELAAGRMAAPELEVPLTDVQMVLCREYKERFGGWLLHCDLLLRLDPGYVGVMLRMLTAIPAGPGLTAQESTLRSLGLSACFTAFNPDMT